MKRFILLASLLVSSVAWAAGGVGINYSTIINAKAANVADVIEVDGYYGLRPQVDATAKVSFANIHNNSDASGVGVELGAKFKMFDQSPFNPWVQPALTYEDSFGYVIDAGIDISSGKLVVTPGVSYGSSWQESGNTKNTYGIKIGYEIAKNQVVYIRARRESPNDGYDVDRLYAGYEFKF